MNPYSDEQVRISCDMGRWIEQRRRAQEAIGLCVIRARSADMTWAMIGLALGTSAQAAWERYGLTAEQIEQRSRQNTSSHTQLTLELLTQDKPPRTNRVEPREGHSEDREDKQP